MQAFSKEEKKLLDWVNTKRIFTGAVMATLALSVSATAQDVVLKMENNAGPELTGTLLEVTETSFVIDSTLGPMRVSRDVFTCVGAVCPAEGSTQISAVGPIVWDVSLWGSRRAFTEHVERLAELVDEKTSGEFTLNISYGGLSPSRENLDNISIGTFEMAQFCSGYHPEKTPMLSVLELPFLGVSSLEQELELSLAVYDHPAVKADLARWNATLLMPSPQPQNNILGVGQPPMSLGSFRDMTIRSTGGIGLAIEALGAQSITIPAPQVSEALADGSVQAVAFAPHAHMAFNTVESGVWWTSNLNPGTSNCPVVVNTDALNGLSTPNRVALLSSVDEALDHYINHYNGVTMAAWGPALKENFIMELDINDEILAAIDQAVAAPAAQNWIARNRAEGRPAQEIYDLVTSIISE
ncbi:C4-dicarboxylate TRAP transporter substrate-binding protein [Roseobacter sp. CCS2]|uniref:C4-dicarboxylate TRAP transporter substrate-binding protein n=1 Tax=Roseobacter sp. CCS2 TaxID=391593 RepID=UPI0000F3E601|nr:C4-dicarboxylate TRAP transporter substrate-binding protein [Roseobacter sp. CCS2]EBA11030.1 TRAP dicarboxylate transporter- DctP subunit [Roseobacter sp. CCS2]